MLPDAAALDAAARGDLVEEHHFRAVQRSNVGSSYTKEFACIRPLRSARRLRASACFAGVGALMCYSDFGMLERAAAARRCSGRSLI
jgi:hypothetical protein